MGITQLENDMALRHSLEELSQHLVWSAEDAGRMIGVTRSTIYDYINEGKFKVLKESPIRLDPAHVRAQLLAGMPVIAEPKKTEAA
jgi:hypothetical protein